MTSTRNPHALLHIDSIGLVQYFASGTQQVWGSFFLSLTLLKLLQDFLHKQQQWHGRQERGQCMQVQLWQLWTRPCCTSPGPACTGCSWDTAADNEDKGAKAKT